MRRPARARPSSPHAGQRGEKNRVKRFNAYFGELMQTPMKLGWFLAIVVIAVAAVFMLLVFAYYMYRTGNSTTTSARELAFRNFLENTLIARPRTKGNDRRLADADAFHLVAAPQNEVPADDLRHGMTIGLVSVVNTFLHIRTPFLLSLLRTGWGTSSDFSSAQPWSLWRSSFTALCAGSAG